VDGKPVQTDRVTHILQDPPQKLAFKKTFVPPAPYTMFQKEPYEEAGARNLGRDVKVRPRLDATRGAHVSSCLLGRKRGSPTGPATSQFDPKASMSPENFQHLTAKDKSALARPGFDQGFTASLHDKYYPKDE
jgi:hypothetical protein